MGVEIRWRKTLADPSIHDASERQQANDRAKKSIPASEEPRAPAKLFSLLFLYIISFSILKILRYTPTTHERMHSGVSGLDVSATRLVVGLE